MPAESTSASQRLEIARAATKRAFLRELLHAGILARLWPSYVALARTEKKPNDEFPYILCVESPIGTLVWRLATDELVQFEWLGTPKPNTGERVEDRTPILLHLASEGW